MKILLAHSHYSQDHLDYVQAQMQRLGAPVIKAVWSEAWDAWVALEGCHRIRAAAVLGLTPKIQAVEYDEDVTLSDLGILDTGGDDYCIGRIYEDAWRNPAVSFWGGEDD